MASVMITRSTLYKTQYWIWRVLCLLLCITSIVCNNDGCPENSVLLPWIFTKCLCNPGYYDILDAYPMVCHKCPTTYNAKELTDAHAASAVKNCIEIYQNS